MPGFEAQTYTQIPNSLFITMKDMDECELKVVLLICRYTFGYHRDEVRLSLRRIAREIGMSLASTSKGAEAAVKRGLIEKVNEGNGTTTWRALVDVPEIDTPRDVPVSSTPVYQNLTQDVPEFATQVGSKESNKDNPKEKGAGTTPARQPKMDVIAWEQNKAAMAARREAETGIKAALLDRFNAFPSECRFTLMWLQDCYQWPASSIPVQSKNKKRNAEYAFWVDSLRRINALLVGVTDKNQVLSAAAKKLEDVTVSSPASLVKTVGWAVGQYSKRQQAQEQRNQKQAEPTAYERALLRRQQRQSQNVPTA